MEMNAEAPRTIARACGGWLAVAPLNLAFKMAVISNTKDNAVQKL
jgi:hypothetical protein